MQQFPDGPSFEQQVRDAAGYPDSSKMDAQRATMILQRMKRGIQNLQKAVRWPGRSNHWSEYEMRAAEHDYQCQVEAIDFALNVLLLLTTAPL